MQVYLVHAEHFNISEVILRTYATEAGAVKMAVELTNILLADCGWQKLATPLNYAHHVERVQDEHGAAHCFVEVIKQDVET